MNKVGSETCNRGREAFGVRELAPAFETCATSQKREQAPRDAITSRRWAADTRVTCSRKLLVATLIAAFTAAALFVASLKLPVWHLKMEAPQYQGTEALRVRVYPGSMRGDLREITVLNKYIGVRIPEHLPQLRWLPSSLVIAAGLGLAAFGLPGAARWRLLLSAAALVSLVMLASAVAAQWQMHRIGHERDPHAALKGVPNFTPPLLGRVKVANFEITTGLGLGAGLLATGIALQVLAGLAARAGYKSKSEGCKLAPGVETHLQPSTCNLQPITGGAPGQTRPTPTAT